MAVAFPILFLIVSLTFWFSSKVEDSQQWVTHTHEVQYSLIHILSTLQDAETGQRGFLLTRDNNYLEPFYLALKQLQNKLDTLEHLTIDNPRQQISLKQMKPLVKEKVEELNNTVNLMQKEGLQSALRLVKTNSGKEAMDQIRAIIKKMDMEEQALLIDRSSTLKQDQTLAQSIQVLGIISLIIMSFFVLLKVKSLLSTQSELHETILASNKELNAQNIALKEAMSTIKTISGIVPLCAWCSNQIQSENGEWLRLEEYIEGQTNAQVSHGMCPSCQEKVQHKMQPHG